jgi:hypothetical protein
MIASGQRCREEVGRKELRSEMTNSLVDDGREPITFEQLDELFDLGLG